MRSPVAEAVVDPNSVAAEVAATAVGAVRIALAAGTGRLSIATANTVAAGYSSAAAAVDSLAEVVDLGSLVGAVTALPDVEPEAP